MQISKIVEEKVDLAQTFNSLGQIKCLTVDKNADVTESYITKNCIKTKNVRIVNALITLIDSTKLEMSMNYTFYLDNSYKIEPNDTECTLMFPIIKNVDDNSYLISDQITDDDKIKIKYILMAIMKRGGRDFSDDDDGMYRLYFDTEIGWRAEILVTDEDDISDSFDYDEPYDDCYDDENKEYLRQCEEGAWEPDGDYEDNPLVGYV